MKKRYGITLAGVILLIVISIISYQNFTEQKVRQGIKQNKNLVVLTRNSPITYYNDVDGLAGFEYDLVTAFAEYYGIDVKFKIMGSVAEIIEAMEAGQGDLAASSLTITNGREERFTFSPSYMTVQQQIVCRRGGYIPESVEELENVELLVIDQSSYLERLRELKQAYPQISWSATREHSTESILEMVWKKEVDCAIADSNIVAINRRYYPELVVAFPVSEQQQLGWIINDNLSFLKEGVENWLAEYANSGELAILKERYYGHVEIFDYVDLSIYHRHIRQRLPKYQRWFKEAGKRYDIPWQFLASQAYQESHWNPKAKSPTGVRGIMMLTLSTARAMDVSNRLNPRQSIFGGARYLDRMKGRIPEAVNEDDRLKYALAAYNVGMGHIHDAQILARELDKDPNRWKELKEVLPLLSQKQYYEDLKYGYARGSEPVRYVDRILNYHDILQNEAGK